MSLRISRKSIYRANSIVKKIITTAINLNLELQKQIKTIELVA